MPRLDKSSTVPSMSSANLSSDGEESAGSDKLPVRLPPGLHLRYDLTEAFSVLVGIKPNRMRFTVHRDLITKRSEFFRAARSKCWTEPSKVIRLVDDDPVVFEAYLHCLYFGSDSFGEPIPDNDKDKEVEKQHAEHHESARFLIDLYLMADRYLDPTAANVVMRGLVTFVHSRPWNPSEATIAKVYARTTEGNPLRMFIRDWRLFETDQSWALDKSKAEPFLPLAFLQDIIIENARLRVQQGPGMNPFRGLGSTHDVDKYYQKVEQEQ